MLVAVRGGEGAAVGGMASSLGGVRVGVVGMQECRLMIKESGLMSGSSMGVSCGYGTSGDLEIAALLVSSSPGFMLCTYNN
jgi:hypothetical protein